MCCFDFCSLLKSSKALRLPSNSFTSSALFSSGVPLFRAAAQSCLEPTEGTSQPVVFAICFLARSTGWCAPCISTAWNLCSHISVFRNILHHFPLMGVGPLDSSAKIVSTGNDNSKHLTLHTAASCLLQQQLLLFTAALSKTTV